MRKIELKLSKNLLYPIYVIAVLGIFSFFRGCSTASENKKLRKEITELKSEVHSLDSTLNVNFYTKQELDKRMEIEGLKTSKRTLYDWNAVIRTTVRPDDRMNEYDKQIKALQNEIK
jgi:sensor domain CHASE-containing protein